MPLGEILGLLESMDGRSVILARMPWTADSEACLDARNTARPLVAINVRCLEGVDVAGLTITEFDGKSL